MTSLVSLPARRLTPSRSRVGSAACLLAAASCVPQRPISIDGAPTDRVVIVAIGSDGAPLRAELHPIASAPAEIDQPDGERLVAFRLEQGAFVSPVLGGDVLAGAGARLASSDSPRAGAGACGRCLIPVESAPAIVHPGDSCTIPRFAAIYGDALGEDEISRARHEVRLEWPGACPSALVEPGPTAPASACPIGPEGSPWPPTEDSVVRVAPDGSTFVADVGLVAYIAPDGTIFHETEHVLPPRWSWFQAEALEAADGRPRLVLATEQDLGGMAAPTEIWLAGPGVDGAAFARASRGGLPAFQPSRVRRVGPREVHVLGTERPGIGIEPVFAGARCTLDSTDRLSCAPLVADSRSCGAPVRAWTDSALLASGGGVGTTSGGAIALRAPGTEEWRCSPPLGVVSGSGEPLLVRSLALVVAEGERFYVCGSALREGAGGSDTTFVATASVTAWPSGGAPPEFRFESVADLGIAGTCRHLTIEQGRGPRVVIAGGVARVIELDRSLRPLAPPRSLEAGALGPEIPSAVMDLVEEGPWRVARTDSGAIYRSRDGRPFERVFGPAGPTAAPLTALAPAPGGGAVAFAGGDVLELPLELAPACDQALRRRALPAPWRSDDRPSAAILDPDPARAGRWLVAGRTAEGASFLRSVDTGGGSAAIVELDVQTKPIIGLAPISTDVVLLADDGSLSLLSSASGGVRPIRVGFDDPTTERIEPTPVDSTPWRALSAASGVVWVAGDGALGRIRMDAPDPQEGWWLARLDAALESPGEVTRAIGALYALGPDQVVLGSVSRRGGRGSQGTSDRLEVMEVRPRVLGCGAAPVDARSELVLCPDPLGVGPIYIHGRDLVIGIAGPAADLTYALGRKALARRGVGGMKLPFEVSALAGAGTFLVAGGPTGTLAGIRIERPRL